MRWASPSGNSSAASAVPAPWKSTTARTRARNGSPEGKTTIASPARAPELLGGVCVEVDLAAPSWASESVSPPGPVMGAKLSSAVGSAANSFTLGSV